MHRSPAELELALRKSPKRRDVLLMLASLSEATPRALAAACGMDAGRLKMIMEGRPPYYAVERSWIPLGCAEVRLTPNGRVYCITERGRKKARQISARSVRNAAAKRATRAIARGEALQKPVGGANESLASGAATASFGWSITCGRI